MLYLTSGALRAERFSKVAGSGFVTSIFGQPTDAAEEQVRYSIGVPCCCTREQAAPPLPFTLCPTLQALASQLNEWYSGIAYLTPLVGGLLADRVTGARTAVIVGGVLMAAGHACMAFEGLFLLVRRGLGCMSWVVHR